MENIITLTNKVVNNDFFIFVIFGIYLLCIVINSKINILDIIKEHLKTLKNYSTKKISAKDLLTFFIIPAILVICLRKKCIVNQNSIQIILTVFSIFAGLMFNLLILIMDIGRRVKQQGKCQNDKTDKQKITEELISQTYSNTAFSIVISLFVICIILICASGILINFIKNIIAVLVYWLIIVFVMTLYMILKRVFILLEHELGEKNIKQ